MYIYFMELIYKILLFYFYLSLGLCGSYASSGKGHIEVLQYPHIPETYPPFTFTPVEHQGFLLLLPLIHVLYFFPRKFNGNLHSWLVWGPETVLQVSSSDWSYSSYDSPCSAREIFLLLDIYWINIASWFFYSVFENLLLLFIFLFLLFLLLWHRSLHLLIESYELGRILSHL